MAKSYIRSRPSIREPQRVQCQQVSSVDLGMGTRGVSLSLGAYHIWDSQCVILITPTPPPSRR